MASWDIPKTNESEPIQPSKEELFPLSDYFDLYFVGSAFTVAPLVVFFGQGDTKRIQRRLVNDN